MRLKRGQHTAGTNNIDDANRYINQRDDPNDARSIPNHSFTAHFCSPFALLDLPYAPLMRRSDFPEFPFLVFPARRRIFGGQVGDKDRFF